MRYPFFDFISSILASRSSYPSLHTQYGRICSGNVGRCKWCNGISWVDVTMRRISESMEPVSSEGSSLFLVWYLKRKSKQTYWTMQQLHFYSPNAMSILLSSLLIVFFSFMVLLVQVKPLCARPWPRNSLFGTIVSIVTLLSSRSIVTVCLVSGSVRVESL